MFKNSLPIIGLVAEIDDEMTTRVVSAYVRAIEITGGVPILLPYTASDKLLDSYAELCDGFLFTGGVDIDPVRYGEECKPECEEIQRYRDAFELSFIEKVFSTGKPILAICRGAQLLNVALGGTLYQDIPTELPLAMQHRQTEPKFSPSHDALIVEGTPLFSLIGERRMEANSFHHQAIRALGRGLRVMAEADDGIIEAVYAVGDEYIRAYQWHPERLAHVSAENRMIFKDFISACISNSNIGRKT